MFKNITDHKKYVIFSYLTVGVNLITGFILFPLIINRLGLEALGVFGLLFSIYSIIAIGLGWLSGSVVKNLTKYKYLKNKIFSFSLYLNIGYGIFAALLIIIYAYLVKVDNMVIFYYFSLYTLFCFVTIPYYNVMTSELRQFQVAFFRFLQQFIFMLLSISSFLIFKPNSLDSIFLSLFFSVLIVFILVVLYFYKYFNIQFKFSKINKILIHRLFVSDGFKYFVNGMTTILLLQIDIFLIDYLYGSASAGIYLIIWKIPNTIIMLGWRLSDPFAVIVASELQLNHYNKILKQFYILEKKLLFGAFVVSVIYFFLASFILNIWIGKENIPNIDYIYFVTAIVILFSVMQRLYLSVNYYTNGLNTTSALQFIEIVFKIIFIVFFFEYFKELAPIVGWLVAFLFTIWFYRKKSLKILIK